METMFGVFKSSPERKALIEIAEQYHKRCDDYDRMICGNKEGIPVRGKHVMLIGKNAQMVLKEQQKKAFLAHINKKPKRKRTKGHRVVKVLPILKKKGVKVKASIKF